MLLLFATLAFSSALACDRSKATECVRASGFQPMQGARVPEISSWPKTSEEFRSYCNKYDEALRCCGGNATGLWLGFFQRIPSMRGLNYLPLSVDAMCQNEKLAEKYTCIFTKVLMPDLRSKACKHKYWGCMSSGVKSYSCLSWLTAGACGSGLEELFAKLSYFQLGSCPEESS